MMEELIDALLELLETVVTKAEPRFSASLLSVLKAQYEATEGIKITAAKKPAADLVQVPGPGRPKIEQQI